MVRGSAIKKGCFHEKQGVLKDKTLVEYPFVKDQRNDILGRV
jgi:hypothetical protein